MAEEPSESRDYWIRALIDAVTLTPAKLVIRLDTMKVEECLKREWDNGPKSATAEVPTCLYRPNVDRRWSPLLRRSYPTLLPDGVG